MTRLATPGHELDERPPSQQGMREVTYWKPSGQLSATGGKFGDLTQAQAIEQARRLRRGVPETSCYGVWTPQEASAMTRRRMAQTGTFEAIQVSSAA